MRSVRGWWCVSREPSTAPSPSVTPNPERDAVPESERAFEDASEPTATEPTATEPEHLDVPWQHRISTRLTFLLLGVIAVLAAATTILLWRGLAALMPTPVGVDPGLGPVEGVIGQGVVEVDPAAVGAVLRGTLVNLAAVVAVTLVAAAAFSRAILADPIARLTAATRALAAGDRSVRLQLGDRSELGELARAFDGMADALTEAQDRLEARVAARTAELRALLSLSNTVALTTELQPQLEAVLDRLGEAGQTVAAEVLELEPSGRLVTIARRGSVPRVAVRSAPSDRTADGDPFDNPAPEIAPNAVVDGDALALPLRVRDRVVGVLHAFAPTDAGWDEDRLRWASGLAAQAAVAVENARLYERARDEAADEERRHLARELHDSVSQAIYSVVLTAHAAQQRTSSDPEGARAALDTVIELAEAALAEMRALIFELRPEALADVGLIGALQRQLDGVELRHGLATTRHLGDEPDLAFATKQVLLRIAQEAIHNVVKHAQARTVTVRTTEQGDTVELEIADDGVGFDADGSYPGHLGLTSMHERVTALGGRLQVDSVPGHGTVVRVRVPVTPTSGGDAS